MTDARALFAQYLDLAPLRGRHRGLVVCIFHRDRRPSLSVDLDAGLFHCFGCGIEGGVIRFGELVGERHARTRPARDDWIEPLRAARQQIINAERRHQTRRDALRAAWEAADAYRAGMDNVHAVRSVATRLGSGELVWELLETAAAVETDLLAQLAAAGAES